jgi:phosphatidylglycerophosphate synthase
VTEIRSDASMSSPTICLVGRTDARPFSQSSLERMRRMFGRAGASEIRDDGEALPGQGRLVLVRADHVFDDALARPLVERDNFVLLAPFSGRPVAAAVPAEKADAARALLTADSSGTAAIAALGLRAMTPQALGVSYRKNLRNNVPPYVLPTRDMDVTAIERHMFMASYKGLTDIVTKYVWPAPALVATRWCAALGISPNAVTLVSFLCVVAATLLFWFGWFLPGLLFAWAMCFLDTVDGKLARVTLTSSKWGNVFDHGTDLIHPPFWWFAWYWGLGTLPFAPPPGMQAAMWIVLAGYVLGRIEEGIFLWAFKFEMFTWRPIDAASRLITARRNPNLIILSAFALAGRPDLGLAAVAVWTVLCLGFHAVRIVQAFAERWRGRPVASYLAGSGAAA